MNNNFWIDQYENDEEPDYPYRRDHRGYNVYGGADLTPQTQGDGRCAARGTHLVEPAEQKHLRPRDVRQQLPRALDACAFFEMSKLVEGRHPQSPLAVGPGQHPCAAAS